MKFEKMTMAILSIFAVILMIIPAIAVNEINDRTTTNILAVEGLYNDGENILIGTPNCVEIQEVYDCDYLGGEANNDTAFINWVSGLGADNTFMGNYITYIGDGNYTLVPDYTDNPEVPQTTGLIFVIELNITTTELLNMDFLRLNIDTDYNSYIVFDNEFGVKRTWQSIETSANETLFVPTLIVKSWLQQSVNSTVFLQLGEIGVNNFDSEPTTVPFKLESFELTSAHALEFQDTAVYFMTIFALNVMYTIAFIFATDTMDIFVDKNRKNKR